MDIYTRISLDKPIAESDLPDSDNWQAASGFEPAALSGLNSQIQQAFARERDQDTTRHTHYFGGRYENTYIDQQRIAGLDEVLDAALQLATGLLGRSDIRAGFWFNAMPPGTSTTLHRHDDDDELLSAVYYIHTPVDSGKLVIHDGDRRYQIEPRAGDIVFFSPQTPHEVTVNNSTQERLSIGINFGPAGNSNAREY